MKKNFIYWCMFVFSVSFLSSCNEDKATKDDLLGTWNLRSNDAMDMAWESSESMIISSIPVPTSVVAGMAAEYGSTQLQKEVKSITFKGNNTLEVTYLDDETNAWKTEVYGTYRVINRKKLVFHPDADKLLEGVEGLSDANLAEIKTLASKAGISVHFTFTGQSATGIRFYLDTNTIKEMKVLIPLLSGSISGDSAEDVILRTIFEALPGLLDKTDKIEIGLSFDKVV